MVELLKEFPGEFFIIMSWIVLGWILEKRRKKRKELEYFTDHLYWHKPRRRGLSPSQITYILKKENKL